MENYAFATKEEVEEMKKRILQGDFLDKNYLTQYRPVDCSSALKRFCLYRSGAEQVWHGEDCDVSFAAVVTYAMMYNWLDINSIQWQPGSYTKYCVMSILGNQYYGDTMTSAWTVFRRYLFYLWDKEPEESCFRELFDRDEKVEQLVTPEYKEYKAALKKGEVSETQLTYPTFQDYFYKLIIHKPQALEIIEERTSARSKNFLNNYMMPGNFIVVPCGFNYERSGRGHAADLDTVDRMLWAIYHYFRCIKNKNEIEAQKYLNKLFAKIADNQAKMNMSVSNFKNWLKDAEIHTWDEFTAQNCMDPFVSKEDGKPISLKTGKQIPEDDKDYDPMPKCIDECECFFKTVNDGILERNQLVWKRCRDYDAKKKS